MNYGIEKWRLVLKDAHLYHKSVVINILLTHLPYQYICPSFLSLTSARIKVFCIKVKTDANEQRTWVFTDTLLRGLQQTPRRKMLKEYWSYNFCFLCLSGAIQTEGLNNTVMKNDCILYSSFIPTPPVIIIGH